MLKIYNLYLINSVLKYINWGCPNTNLHNNQLTS